MKQILFLLLITISLQAQTKDVTLALPWKHQFQFAGYYVAKELGFYEKAGLNVNIKEYDLSMDISKGVATMKYEFGVGHSFLIIDKLNKYNGIVLLNAIYQSSPMILLSRKREDIKTLSDLVGKKVMTSRDQIHGASINAMLFSQNVRQSEYEIIDPSFNPMDLVDSTTDFMTSYSSNEPYTLEQKGIQYTIFDPKDYGYDFYSDILFTSAIMLKNNQKDVDAFRAASLDGWRYAYEHIDEAVDIILKKYNTQKRTRKALEFEAKTLKKLSFTGNINFGDINPIKLNEITTTYRLLGLINTPAKIDFNTFIYKSASDFVFYENHLDKPEKNYFKFLDNFYFRLFSLISLITLFIALYFSSRMKNLLKEKTIQLEKQNKIFDENVCSSKTDLDGNITYVSEAFCNLTGYTQEGLKAKKHNILRDEHTPIEIYKDLWITISSGHIWKGELKNRKKDGSEYFIKAIIKPIFDENSNIVAYESIVQDITLKNILQKFNTKLEYEVKKQTKKLEKLAATDKLTGIYNRVKLDDELTSNYEYFKEFNEDFAIIILDIDHFKKVNDTHGHQIGDKILIEITKLILQNVRSTDTVGRWGGEEFMVICPKTDTESAYKVAQNIRKSIELHNFARVGKLTICAGLSNIKSNKDLDNLVSKADSLLYDAKHGGRNMVKR